MSEDIFNYTDPDGDQLGIAIGETTGDYIIDINAGMVRISQAKFLDMVAEVINQTEIEKLSDDEQVRIAAINLSTAVKGAAERKARSDEQARLFELAEKLYLKRVALQTHGAASVIPLASKPQWYQNEWLEMAKFHLELAGAGAVGA